MAEASSGDLKLDCFFCELPFSTRKHLHSHLKTHVCEKRHKCDICKLVFGSSHKLEAHICVPCHCFRCDPEGAEKYVEGIYSRFLKIPPTQIDRTSAPYLKRLHFCRRRREEEDETKATYTCTICGSVIKGLPVFVKHMQVHAKTLPPKSPGKASFYCIQCKISYRGSIPYLKHLKRHLIAIVRRQGIRERGVEYDFSKESYEPGASFVCPVTSCRASLQSDIAMIKHMERHLAKFSFVNDLPSKDLYSDSNIPSVPVVKPSEEEATPSKRQRKQDLNSSLSPLADESSIENVCDVCPRTYFLPSYLLDHKIITHDYQGSSCRICYRRLESVDKLLDHVREIHDPQKLRELLRCVECKTEYSSYGNYLQHCHDLHNFVGTKCQVCALEQKDVDRLINHAGYHKLPS